MAITTTPGVCGGSPRLHGTRLPVWLLEQMRRQGFTDALLLDAYPHLTAADLAAAWEYVAGHTSEIDREIIENERY